ncbi:MAG: ABC transporter permease, partial [archaeon]
MFIKKEIVNYSLKSIVKRKTRSILTILSILIGITAIFIFISFGFGLYAYINSFSTSTSADKITVMPKGNSAPGLNTAFALNDSDIKAVEKSAGITEATGVYSRAAEVKKKDVNKYVFLVSYDPAKPLVLELASVDIVEGRKLQSNDMGKAVVGYNYKLENKVFSTGYKLGDSIEINGVNVRIIGFVGSMGNPSDDSQIYITNDYFKKLYPNVTSYAEIIARADINDISNTIKRVEKNLRNSRDQKEGEEDFFVSSFQDLIAQFSSALNIVIGFVILIALISVVVSAVNTANTTTDISAIRI